MHYHCQFFASSSLITCRIISHAVSHNFPFGIRVKRYQVWACTIGGKCCTHGKTSMEIPGIISLSAKIMQILLWVETKPIKAAFWDLKTMYCCMFENFDWLSNKSSFQCISLRVYFKKMTYWLRAPSIAACGVPVSHCSELLKYVKIRANGWYKNRLNIMDGTSHHQNG